MLTFKHSQHRFKDLVRIELIGAQYKHLQELIQSKILGNIHYHHPRETEA